MIGALIWGSGVMRNSVDLQKEYKKALSIAEEFISRIIVEFGPKGSLCVTGHLQ